MQLVLFNNPYKLLLWILALVLVVASMATATWFLLFDHSATHKQSLKSQPKSILTQASASVTPQASPSATATMTPTPTATSSATPTTLAATTKATSTPVKKPTPTPTIYPLHQNILTTYFWAGETESADNKGISNVPSAWVDDWSSHFGGVDSPTQRSGYFPTGFTPKENTFYFALPYSDYDNQGIKANTSKVYWYAKFADGQSILKNRWIAVTANGKTAYAQWEDVGPFNEDDVDYVFGNAAPAYKVGLDVSPAVRDYLGLGDESKTSWRFVEQSQVPDGPWKQIITTSSPDWQ